MPIKICKKTLYTIHGLHTHIYTETPLLMQHNQLPANNERITTFCIPATGEKHVTKLQR